MLDNDVRQDTPQRDQDTPQRDAESTTLRRLTRMVIRIVVVSLYTTIAAFGLTSYVVSGASSIQLGQLMGAINLVMWGYFAMLVGCELDRCWGHTRTEHILTVIACVCIGLAMYNCLANVLLNPSLPTLEQVAPLIAAIDATPIAVIVVVAPIVAFVLIQERRAGAR